MKTTNASLRPALGLLATLLSVGAALIVPAGAGAVDALLDHPVRGFAPTGPPSSEFNSGGPGAKWELIETISTGNPQTDLDFFSRGGETYASVGTLAIGPNGGGQTILKLTEGDKVDPSFVSSQPSATCISNPAAALGLQHDVESTPKGAGIPLNTTNPFAVQGDAQLLIDATDAAGRCHDQGVLGLQGAPLGGLELIDITDVTDPVEIGMTSHIGQAHTVNVDPKRPQIAYAATSDAVSVSVDANDIDKDGNTTELIRENEDPKDADRFDLDGFEVVDLSTCMNFPGGTSVDMKRASCRPEVYRYRYPTLEMSLGSTIKTGTSAAYGCHELEVYPDDKLTCGSGNALIELDMSGAFNDMGTPDDFTDDKPRGTPLPCKVRPSSSSPPFTSGAMVADCVDGTNDANPGPGGVGPREDLTVPGWLASGAPSLEGVEYLGSIYHQGGGPGQGSIPPFNSKQDLAFNHEAELSGSGQTLIATDERGGGVVPPGASCSPGVDNAAGNGGLQFFRADAISKTPPASAEEAQRAYAKTPEGEKAIFRATVRTKAQASVCTAHIFQQIPGENRVFMAWYSQGTQVIDFVEEPNGRIRFIGAGYMIPENANTWSSQIFKTEQNKDGTTTYYGATGDFNVGEAGRNSIDIYKVTLPPAPKVATVGGGGPGGGGPGAEDCSQTLSGSGGNDRLLGSIAGDRIQARGGNDTVKGRAGEDCLKGGSGKDKVKGGDEDDTLNGGKGRDRLNGGNGSDLVKGGIDRDRLAGGDGGDLLRSRGGGRDVLVCGRGKDVAIADKRDVTRGCEKVKVRRKGK